MARTTAAVAQTIWGCRWSRPGHRISGVEEYFQPEPTWVCIRDGDRALVPEGKCDTCPRWEPDPEKAN
jgi:hypothetical protein